MPSSTAQGFCVVHSSVWIHVLSVGVLDMSIQYTQALLAKLSLLSDPVIYYWLPTDSDTEQQKLQALYLDHYDTSHHRQ